jgi:uncharacterized membrane protein YkvA (DUF1232 family)
MNIFKVKNWRKGFEKLEYETYAIYLSYKDPRVPWYIKILIILFLGYILSPIDFIPDFIPVLGYLDDFILVTVGIPLLHRMIPKEILKEHEEEARLKFNDKNQKIWYIGFIVILIWLLIIFIILRFILSLC